MTYRTFDHTADLGLEVEADTLAALLGECARAFRELTIDAGDLVPADGVETWAVEAGDLGALVVAWLEQLLFLWDARGVMVTNVDTRVHGDHPWRAAGHGRRAVAGPGTEVAAGIKAVTWHGLVVEERPGGWFARVIFDV